MLTLKLINEETERVIRGLEKKHFAGAKEAIDNVLAVDKRRREAQQELDKCLNEQKQLSGQIGRLMKEGKKDEAEQVKAQVAQLKEKSKEMDDVMAKAQDEMTTLLCQIPNIPYDEVPEGRAAEDNHVVKSNLKECTASDTVGNWDVNPKLGIANPLPHWELAKKYNLIDFDLGVKITGAGFPVYIGKGAKIQRALIAYFLDRNTKAGYLEVQPPLVVNEDSAFATGQLPDKGEQMYYIGLDKFYMIPTAEVPVTNIYRDCIVPKKNFPIKMTAYTQCFRREAGSYGKDVRGLNRLHQFDKVEIVQLALPEESYKALDGMVAHVESLVQELGLPYRILRLCGGDMSFTSAITYDFEVYSQAQGRWLEVSSVSNFETYQANRMKLRFKDDDGKIRLAHTLNGSSLALPRILASILEDNQMEDGRIRVPDCLRPYTGFDFID